MFLLQKGPYQAFYGPDGRLERLLQDRNGDDRADVVTLFDDEGRPSVTEIDSDGDGVVDRWERYSPTGGLAKVETSRRKRGAPDVWEELDEDGRVVRREIDDDGDGTPDRVETPPPIATQRVEQDVDAEGRPHRWEVYEGARLAAEELDTDGDGHPDRRLVRGALGELVRIEKLEDGRWVEVAVEPR